VSPQDHHLPLFKKLQAQNQVAFCAKQVVLWEDTKKIIKICSLTSKLGGVSQATRASAEDQVHQELHKLTNLRASLTNKELFQWDFLAKKIIQ
jgi:hypothetical protein